MNDNNQLPKQANSIKDKVLILQARDKYVKSQRIKQTDISKAQVVSGNCQDMCPESERYRRIEHDLVSIFEKSDGEPDEHKLVKEYVRSSADQDEPLPHELRPADVLERTMLYLARNVIDLIDYDENIDIEQWYDFLWNRTRAIRKEIVQQDLNCLTSVQLMERCARFHIYSAHRFVETDLNVFPKINEENLTKSIQSLKDFYYDLSLKNIQCPNEAEFRGYDILLNLLNGDILREISILKPAIRNSEPVKFAAKVLTAFNNKNFVKFFDLMREATFLNGCIMHRYFGIMRIQAFRLLRKAFTVFTVNQKEYFSKEHLFDQLCFEEDNEFDDFCDSINVEVDKNEDIIILDKNSLQEFKNDDSLPQPFEFVDKRSIEYIEAKKGNKLLSELIFKEKMGDNPYKKYPLQNSFDENGQLISTEIELDKKKIKIDQATVCSFANASNKKEIKSDQPRVPTINFGTSSKGLFSQPNLFKSVQQPNAESNSNLFGKKQTTQFSINNNPIQSSNIFSLPNTTSQPSSGLFSSVSRNLFGKDTETSQVNTNNLFGSNKESSCSTNLFGKESQSSASLFGTTQNQISSSNLFSNPATNKPFSFKLPSDSKTVKEEEESQPPIDKPKENKLTEEELTYLIATVFQNLLDEVLHDSIEKSILNMFINDQSIQMTNLIMTEVVLQIINDLCQSVYNNEMKKQEKLKNFISETSAHFCDQLIKEQVNQSVSSIAKKLYIEELNSFIHKKSELISDSYFEETLEELIFNICAYTYQTELNERQRIVNYIKEKRGWRLAQKYFKHWKKRCDYLKRYRFLSDNFPASRMENSPPTLKRILSVPELVYGEPGHKRQLIEQQQIDRPQLYRNTYSSRSSMNLDLNKELEMQEELKTIQENMKKREKHDELSTKSKLDYAKKALDNLKKVSKTFNTSLTFVRPFLSKNNG